MQSSLRHQNFYEGSIMNNSNQIELVKKPTLATRLKQGAVIGAGTALAIHANAASSFDTAATGFTDEIDGAKTIVIGVFTVALTVLAVFVGWRYLKRGANSA